MFSSDSLAEIFSSRVEASVDTVWSWSTDTLVPERGFGVGLYGTEPGGVLSTLVDEADEPDLDCGNNVCDFLCGVNSHFSDPTAFMDLLRLGGLGGGFASPPSLLSSPRFSPSTRWTSVFFTEPLKGRGGLGGGMTLSLVPMSLPPRLAVSSSFVVCFLRGGVVPLLRSKLLSSDFGFGGGGGFCVEPKLRVVAVDALLAVLELVGAVAADALLAELVYDPLTDP